MRVGFSGRKPAKLISIALLSKKDILLRFRGWIKKLLIESVANGEVGVGGDGPKSLNTVSTLGNHGQI